jgi:beta-barrel assembly-enhancing protease
MRVLRLRRSLFVYMTALICATCAGPVSKLPPLSKEAIETERRQEQTAQLRDYYDQLRRVDTVAFGIRTANATDCKEWISAQIGLYAITPQSMPHKFRSFSAEALNLTWVRPTAISVADNSPAAQAGIVKGDEIIALNGELIPLTQPAGWMGAWLKANGVKPVRVDLRHDGTDRTVTVKPVMGCAIPIDYVTADEVNAFTDDSKITISSAIVTLAQTDAELALIIGHELAHANLGHMNKTRINTFLGLASGAMIDLGILAGGVPTGGIFAKQFANAGARAYSVGFEREADYVGAYYAARAGYDLKGAEDIWRNLGRTHPDSIRLASTHPTTPERFLQLQQVEAEIAEKQRHHEPLVPNLKITDTPGEASQSVEWAKAP